MKTLKEPGREIPVYREVDVAVAGAGPAGFSAAVAAARTGARVLLVEKENYVGGLLTCLPILGYYNYQGKQVIFGIAQELVDRLAKLGGTPGHVVDPRPAEAASSGCAHQRRGRAYVSHARHRRIGVRPRGPFRRAVQAVRRTEAMGHPPR